MRLSGHLPDQLRPQPVLGDVGGGAPQGRTGPRLRRPDRGPPAIARWWPSMPASFGRNRTHLRPLALPTGAGQEARRTQERRALRGLGAAAGAGQAEAASLGSGDEADRRFVRVLSLVLRRRPGVRSKPQQSRRPSPTGAASDDVVVNIPARRREPRIGLKMIASRAQR